MTAESCSQNLLAIMEQNPTNSNASQLTSLAWGAQKATGQNIPLTINKRYCFLTPKNPLLTGGNY